MKGTSTPFRSLTLTYTVLRLFLESCRIIPSITAGPNLRFVDLPRGRRRDFQVVYGKLRKVEKMYRESRNSEFKNGYLIYFEKLGDIYININTE